MHHEAAVSSDDEEDGESTGLLRSPGSVSARAEKQLAYGDGGRPTLSLLSVATIAYFSVSGGPFGLELAVSAAGPAAVIALLLVLSVVWSMPCALMTAELSSALPSRAGYMHWVTRALGSAAGGLNGWISLLGSAVDSSTYPAIFCDYAVFALQHWGHQPLGARERFVVSASLTLLMLLLNLRGITLAARASIALAIFSLMPFAIMMLVLFVKTPASAVAAVHAALGAGVAQPNLPLLLSITLWSTSGFDAVSLVSSEVSNARTIPRAMSLSLVMMLAATLGPILVCCAAEAHHAQGWSWSSFNTGSFALSAERLGGRWLGVWACAAGMSACAGLLNAFMCTSARGVQAMAMRGMLPTGLRNEYGAEGTPVPALLFTYIFINVFLVLPFQELIELDMALYTLSLGLELTSLLRLRWTEPHLHRPYRVPLGRRSLVLAYIPCLSLCATMVIVSLRTWKMCAAWVAILLTGWALYSHGPTVFRPAGGGELTKRSSDFRNGNGNGNGNGNSNGARSHGAAADDVDAD